MSKLTDQKKKFAEFYLQNCNATQSAKLAGYSEKTAYSQGQRLLKDVEVKKIIDSTNEKASNKRIADIVERKELLTSFMRNQEDTDDKGRLKALEILGKMEGDFTEKIEITGSLAGIIKESRERG